MNIHTGIVEKSYKLYADHSRKLHPASVYQTVKTLIVLIAVIIPILAVTCPQVPAAETLTVYTVNYPLKYFAEQLGKEHVRVVFPAPAGIDPAYWIPDISTISAYQQADLILLNGAGYAKWIGKVSLPRSKLVNTSKKLKDRYITIQNAVTHSHGSGGEHAHESLAFTTWLDFDLASKQAWAIAGALSRKRPELKKTFDQNCANLDEQLRALDHDIKALVSKNRSQPLVASHPVYDYFIRRYGLNVKSVHWEPDEIPDNEQWMKLKSILKNHPAEWMIWEGQPHTDIAAKLKSMGIGSVVFDPCGNTPEKGDFLSVMRQNVENLKPAFE